VEGEFIWHSHPETDEAFFVVEGQLKILFSDGEIMLNKGDLYVIPKGIEHKPVAEKECQILMIEPEGMVNIFDSASLSIVFLASRMDSPPQQWLNKVLLINRFTGSLSFNAHVVTQVPILTKHGRFMAENKR